MARDNHPEENKSMEVGQRTARYAGRNAVASEEGLKECKWRGTGGRKGREEGE